jgi:hypothetical protein
MLLEVLSETLKSEKIQKNHEKTSPERHFGLPAIDPRWKAPGTGLSGLVGDEVEFAAAIYDIP